VVGTRNSEGAASADPILDQGIEARLQDAKTAGRAVVEYGGHAADSARPEGIETLLGPLSAAAVTAEAVSS